MLNARGCATCRLFREGQSAQHRMVLTINSESKAVPSAAPHPDANGQQKIKTGEAFQLAAQQAAPFGVVGLETPDAFVKF